MDFLFETLLSCDKKATFFCLGWIGRKYPDVIKKIDDYGFQIGSHSDMHELAINQTKKEFKSDLDRSIKTLQDITGKLVKTYRAPAFSIKEENKWVFEYLIEYGIEIDCSIFPARRDFGGFDGFGVGEPCLINYNGLIIKEFPMNIKSILEQKIIFSGGGYFRLLPYWFVRYLFSNSNYTMSYFHPRDFDSDQPVLTELSLNRRFKSYYGLNSAKFKFEKHLRKFDFIDIQTANDLIDWGNVKTIKL
jgi:polysaccharide deacetylase family protein (PEP-CTERM system associated)